MPHLTNEETEEAVISAFVVSRKRERYIGFLRSPQRRRDFLDELYHFNDFEPGCLIPLNTRQNSPEGLLAELRRLGARDECYVISVDRDLDGRTDALALIIPRVYAWTEGTIVSCIPGRLAYYEGEPPSNRFILKARGAGR